MDRLAVEVRNDFLDMVLLKEPDPGDSRRASLEAGTCVLQSDPTEGDDWNLVLASLL